MNAKNAKKLRKIALGLAVAAEQKSGKQINKVSYTTNGTTVEVAAGTHKGAYKALKKGFKNGVIGG